MENERLPRKLAAVLYADVAGYSRATATDEDESHRTLSDYLDLIASTIAGQHGQVMHYAGDAVLAMFEAAVDALACALRIQAEIGRRNELLPEARRIAFRIGLNLGDVILDRGDMYGTGVNVAARLEALAEPGGICVSESVRTAVGQKLALHYEDLGAQALKNLDTPVRAFQVRADSVTEAAPVMGAVARPPQPVWHRWRLIGGLAILVVTVAVGGLWYVERPAPTELAPATVTVEATDTVPGANVISETEPTAPPNSIAVLPFADMSPDKDQEYFADGVAEEILNSLAQVRGLTVIGRTSSFAFKGKGADLREIGRILDVATLLEGSVRKAGESVRITAQLNNARSGSHLWSRTYERGLEDIFAVQAEIAQAVAAAIGITLGVGDPFARPGMTRDVAAYEEFLQARAKRLEFSRQSLNEAELHLRRALQFDPGFAAARQLLYYVYLNTTVLYPQLAADASRQRDQVLAELVTGDPEALITQWAMASQAFLSSRWEEVDRQFARIRARPEAAGQQLPLAGLETNFLRILGRAGDAVALLERTRASNPLDVGTAMDLALSYTAAGRLASAMVEFERALTLDETQWLEVRGYGANAVLATRDRERITAWAKPLIASDNVGAEYHRTILRFLDDPAGGTAALRALVDREGDNLSILAAYILVHGAAYFGDTALTLKLLAHLAEKDDGFMINETIWNPLMSEARRTPEFKEIVRRLGLVNYWRNTGHWGDFCRPVGEEDFECQ